jgi:hypothetical protein
LQHEFARKSYLNGQDYKLDKIYYFQWFDGELGERENGTSKEGTMKNLKKLTYPFGLCFILIMQLGCQGHHQDELIPEKQRPPYNPNDGVRKNVQQPHVESEHGGNAGNR